MPREPVGPGTGPGPEAGPPPSAGARSSLGARPSPEPAASSSTAPQPAPPVSPGPRPSPIPPVSTEAGRSRPSAPAGTHGGPHGWDRPRRGGGRRRREREAAGSSGSGARTDSPIARAASNSAKPLAAVTARRTPSPVRPVRAAIPSPPAHGPHTSESAGSPRAVRCSVRASRKACTAAYPAWPGFPSRPAAEETSTNRDRGRSLVSSCRCQAASAFGRRTAVTRSGVRLSSTPSSSTPAARTTADRSAEHPAITRASAERPAASQATTSIRLPARSIRSRNRRTPGASGLPRLVSSSRSRVSRAGRRTPSSGREKACRGASGRPMPRDSRSPRVLHRGERCGFHPPMDAAACAALPPNSRPHGAFATAGAPDWPTRTVSPGRAKRAAGKTWSEPVSTFFALGPIRCRSGPE